MARSSIFCLAGSKCCGWAGTEEKDPSGGFLEMAAIADVASGLWVEFDDSIALAADAVCIVGE